MIKKMVFVAVQKDVIDIIRWATRDLEKQITFRFHDVTTPLARALADNSDCQVVALDSEIKGESTIGLIKELKASRPDIRILVIISPNTKKEEITDLIQAKSLSAALVRPFTAKQLTEQLAKVCGIEVPTDAPWYAKGSG